jgi:hypothetical protein
MKVCSIAVSSLHGLHKLRFVDENLQTANGKLQTNFPILVALWAKT